MRKAARSVSDYLLWYAKDMERVKYRQLFARQEVGEAGATQYTGSELPDGDAAKLDSLKRWRTQLFRRLAGVCA